MALYLIKKLTPLQLTQIGELFDLDYSAVSQVVTRFENNREDEHEMKRIIEKVMVALKRGGMSNVET